jgi:nicotinamidase/pyrazinamidase
MDITPTTALIVVDVQNDFCPGGPLAAPQGDQVVPVLNRYIKKFETVSAWIIATRDWHPANHSSFKPNGGIWPIHCVQNTAGSEFHPDLHLPQNVMIISKGTDPDREAYSGFQGTPLTNLLKERKIQTVWIGGLATDYCVKSTVLDAVKAGFAVRFLEDASRGVGVQQGDIEKAQEEIIKSGARKLTLDDIGD